MSHSSHTNHEFLILVRQVTNVSSAIAWSYLRAITYGLNLILSFLKWERFLKDLKNKSWNWASTTLCFDDFIANFKHNLSFCYRAFITSFKPLQPPWKHQKTSSFSNVFRGNRKATPGCNGLSNLTNSLKFEATHTEAYFKPCQAFMMQLAVKVVYE